MSFATMTMIKAAAIMAKTIVSMNYGFPPHGGAAFGLERLMMVLTGTENIRDVVLFPKTTTAQCLMSDAPSKVDDAQLEELSILVKEK